MFLNGVMLAGLAAVSVPIVLHLIQRQRYPERRYSTLRFFDHTVRQNVIRRNLVDRLLLLLRVLMLLLLFLALARPFLPLGVGEPSLAVVVVLDDSPTMRRAANGQPLFELARATAARIASELAPADQALLLLSSNSDPLLFTRDRERLQQVIATAAGSPFCLWQRDRESRLLVPDFTTDTAKLLAALAAAPPGAELALQSPSPPPPVLTSDHADFAARLAAAEISERPGNLEAAVRRAGAALAAGRAGDKWLVMLSDAQAADWPDRRSFELAAIKVRDIRFVPDADGLPANLTIESVIVPDAPVRFGAVVPATVRVRNTGTAPVPQGGSLELLVLGQPRQPRLALPAIAPGAQALMPLNLLASTRGDTLHATVRVTSSADAYDYDNDWHFVLAVRQPLRLLCVEGVQADNAADASGYFLRNALAPQAGDAAEVFAEVAAVGPDELQQQELFQYDVVILAEVDELDRAGLERLAGFVRDGGGLVVFPSRQVDAGIWNSWDLLPVIVEPTGGGATFAYIRALSENLPAMADLAARCGGSYQALSSETWLQLTPRDGAETLATLSSGSPALVRAQHGRGTVVVAAAGCHVRSSDWPLRPAFVMLVQTLVEHAAGRKPPLLAEAREVGADLALALPRDLREGQPGVFRLQAREADLNYAAMPWQRRNDRLQARPTTAGHYLLSVQPSTQPGILERPGLGAQTRAFAVNRAAGETPGKILTEEALDALLQARALTHIDGLQDPELRDLEPWHSGREGWRLLAACCLLFLVAESLCGRLLLSETVRSGLPNA